MYQQILTDLFLEVAPGYKAKPMIIHLRRKFTKLNDDDFLVRVSECVKFLFLRSKSGRGFIPLSGEIDDIWHAFILQTQEYANFCLALPGRNFIHHNSISLDDHSEKVSRETSVRNLLEWIPAYIKHFGPFTEEAARYWMIIQLLKQEFDYSLEAINELV
jgi:hypothetical protein